MRKFVVLLTLSLISLSDTVLGSDSVPRAGVSLKITGTHLLCRAQNWSANDVVTDEPFYQDNCFVARCPGLNVDIGYTAHSTKRLTIAGGQEMVWRIALAELVEFAGAGTMMPGQVTRIEWACLGHISNPIWLAVPDENGRFISPDMTVTDNSAKPILAFVFNRKQPPELGFLLLNGTKADVIGANPLTSRSKIVVSVPTIKYTRELTTSETEVKELTVEPGKHAEWRLPWQKVLDLIPKEDLAKIEAAGGDLDLVWKIGDLESAPLPISLAKPGESGAGPQADKMLGRSDIRDVSRQATNAPLR